MNFSSASLACTKTTSASPRRAVSSAWPVPRATTLTTMPVFCLNSGRMWPKRPESCVDVVEATTIDLSCAGAGAGDTASTQTIATRARIARRIGMEFPLLCLFLEACERSKEQLAVDEAARLLGFGREKENLGRTVLDHAAAMHEHDLAGEPLGLAEIVGRHYHFDAAHGHSANDVLDCLGCGRIEARGRLVQKENVRLLGKRARERQPLLLAAGKLSCRPAAEAAEADQGAELIQAPVARSARHAGGRERVADVAGGAAAKHHRALKHDGASRGRHLLASAPAHPPARRRDQAYSQTQQRSLAGAVRADDDRGRSSRKLERDALQERHVAGDGADILEHDRQIGDGGAHGHPAYRSPARRRPQADALTATTIAINTVLSPIASGRSPFDVSSAIAVVMVRVKSSILPPTMITAPTSAAARPKPASSAVTRLKRPSQIRVAMRPSGPTFIAASSSWYSLAKSSMVCRVSAAMMGAMSTVWATIIACGVNRRPHDPSGPERESRR